MSSVEPNLPSQVDCSCILRSSGSSTRTFANLVGTMPGSKIMSQEAKLWVSHYSFISWEGPCHNGQSQAPHWQPRIMRSWKIAHFPFLFQDFRQTWAQKIPCIFTLTWPPQTLHTVWSREKFRLQRWRHMTLSKVARLWCRKHQPYDEGIELDLLITLQLVTDGSGHEQKEFSYGTGITA